MRGLRHIVLLLLLSGLASESISQSTSVLKEGAWVKMAIVKNGVYKLTNQDLGVVSSKLSQVDPRNISIYGNGGKLLPQLIDPSNPLDLEEISIKVEGENDGSFDAEDYILFYAESPESISFDLNSAVYSVKKNYYSDTSWYYLNLGSTPGKRVQSEANIQGSFPQVISYDHFHFQEDYKVNRLGSGREWYGDSFSGALDSRTYNFTIENIVPNSEIKVNTQVMGYSFQATSFDISINSLDIGSLAIPPVIDYEYDENGVEVSSIFSISSSLINSDEIELGYTFQDAPASRRSEGYLDWFVLQTERHLSAVSEQLSFNSSKSLEQPVSSYVVEDVGANTVIWEITNINEPKEQENAQNGSQITFNSNSDELKRFIAFNPSTGLEIPILEQVQNQDIKSESVPDLIIVSPELFLSEAQRLASFRRSNDGLDVLVVTTDQVFNEFSHGIRDPTAIRNMAYYFYHRLDNPQKLKHLLLFGRGSYDHRNVLRRGLNYVPIYESRGSLDPLKTYGSDDYLGFLEDGEGEWIENSSGNHDLEIAVGRLPVKSISEANSVVNKLINYAQDPETLGEWRNKMLFIADDGDFNIHQSQSNQLSRFVDTTYKKFEPIKIFLDNFDQEPRAGGEKSPAMTDAITRSINEGALIVNYTGHGGEAGWTQEFVLDQFIVSEFTNVDRLPLFVTATCEFGRHDNPARISSGEMTLLNPVGGAIGLVSTSRPVFSSTNFQLNRAFYEVVFDEGIEGGATVGELFRLTKNGSTNGVFNRNFSLLGDPSMKLAYPRHRVVIDEVNEKDIDQADTLKAMGMVVFKGRIVDYNNMLVSSFNGDVEVTIFDKQRWIQTLGDENPPFSYLDWNNRLFRGQATVQSGEFNIDLMLPRNMIYTIGEGKVSMYAKNVGGNVDASGSELNIVIGGTEDNNLNDTSAPQVEAYINDESFLEGSTVPSDSRLFVLLSDESGINISNVGVGQQLEAIIDDDKVFNLSDYYKSDIDDFTRGRIEFELLDLEVGLHTIRVKAWDNNNNSAEAEISFFVEDSKGLELGRVLGAPNPFSDRTSISFEHNRPGDDLDVQLVIYNRLGRAVMRENYVVESSPIRVILPEWSGKSNNGQEIDQGIYIVRVSVRSLNDGSKNSSYTKLINLK